MRRADDTRLWFDKADGKTVYGVYRDQRFYSSEFLATSDEEHEAVHRLMEIAVQYSEWAKANYMERRAGRPQVALPQDLIDLLVPTLTTEVRRGEVLDDPFEG